MNTLNFETGLATFVVNGSAEVTFNPTDERFMERLFDAFDQLAKKQDAHKQAIGELKDTKAIFEYTDRMDKEMRETIDAVFAQKISDAIFGSVSVYAMANGLPLWCNFLLAVMDKIDDTIIREKQTTNPRIAKYTAKYHK